MDLAGSHVLVTGADGFIGSHLVETLVMAGCRVRAMALYNSFGRFGWLDALPEKTQAEVEIVLSDIRDRRLCDRAAEGVDVVFHLAAWGGVPFSFKAPQTYLDVNATGTANLMLAALEAGCRRVLHTSTSEVFGTAQRVPIDETHPRCPQSPYAASKVAADALVQSFVASYRLPAVICRPFNTYGPRQSERAVIPTVIQQLLSGVTELQLGALTPTRDLTFVGDTCRAMMALAACDEALGGDFNLGVGEEIAIGALAGRIMDLMGRTIPIVCDDKRLRPAQSEVERLVGDHRRMQKLTGWKPEISLDDGLQRTIAWFTEHRPPSRHGRYSV